MGDASSLLGVVLTSVLTFIIIVFTLFWRIVVGVIDMAKAIYAGISANVFFLSVALGLMIAGGIVASNYQNSIMMTTDVVYESGFSPAAQGVESFLKDLPVAFWNFAVERWNNIADFWISCLNSFISSARMLGSFTTSQGYVDLINALYELWKCYTVGIAITPGWLIPGLDQGIEAIYSLYFCYTDWLKDVFLSVVQLEIFNYDCTFCALDPSQSCALRKNVPGYNVAPPGPACIGCQNFECQYSSCVALTWDVITGPIQILFGIDLTFIFYSLSDAFCCMLGSTFRPPLWLIQGLIDGCIPPNPAVIVNYLIDDWLSPFVVCFNNFILIVSGGVVDNFWELVFSILFPAIQTVIDAVMLLLTCYQSPAVVGCFNSYPNNCASNGQGIATGGLQTCAQIAGTCVTSQSNPLIDATFFNVVIPSVFIPIDTAVCSVGGLQVCFFGPTPPGPGPVTLPDCPNPPGQPFSIPICLLDCIEGRVTLFAPIASVFNSFLGFLQGIINFFNMALAQIASAISQLQSVVQALEDAIEFLTPLRKEVRLSTTRGFSGFRTAWNQTLLDLNIDPTTTCGKILWENDLNQMNLSDVTTNAWFFLCLGLKKIGEKACYNYPNESFNINDFLHVTTFNAALQKDREMYMRTYFEELGYDVPENSTDFRNLEYKNYARLDDNFRKFIFDRRDTWDTFFKSVPANFTEGGADNQTYTYEYYQKVGEAILAEPDSRVHFNTTQLTLTSFVWHLADRWKKSAYYTILSGYVEENQRMRDAMVNAYGWYPGMSQGKTKRAEFTNDKEEREQQIEEGTRLALDVMRTSRSSTLQKLSRGGPPQQYQSSFRRILDEQSYEMAMSELSLRALSALTAETKRTSYVPWYARVDAGVRGGTVSPNELIIEDQKKLRILKSQFRSKLAWSAENDAEFAKMYTHMDIVMNQQAAADALRTLNATYKVGKALYTIGSNADPAALSGLYKTFAVDYWPSTQFATLLKESISTGNYDPIHKVATGEAGYLVGEGIVSRQRYERVMKVKMAEIEKPGSLPYFLLPPTGPETPEKEVKMYGPFLSDPNQDLGLPSFRKFMKNLRKVHIKERMVVLEQMGYNVSAMSEEDIVALITTQNFVGPYLQQLFTAVEWVLNDFFGRFLNIFGVHYHVDLTKTVNDALNKISSSIVNFPTTIFDKGEKFVNKYFTCVKPDQVNGQALYNPFCFPLMPEQIFGFVNPGPDSSIPLQIPWPSELITTDCVNTYNGNPNFFGPFKRSNNCGSPSGSRPYCPNSDYCEREYESCGSFSFSSILDNFFYITGVIPKILDLFYHGGLATRDARSIGLVFALIFVTVVQAPMVVGPQVVISFLSIWLLYWVLWTANIVFDGFFPGPSTAGQLGGGIPYGVIFIGLFLASVVFIPSLYTSVPLVGALFAFLSITWIVNLAWRFPTIYEVLTINKWLATLFNYLNFAPTPLKYINWTPFYDAAVRFDYSDGNVPTIDTFCFGWTFGNTGWLVLAGVFFYFTLALLYVIIWAIVIAVIETITLIFLTITKIRAWAVSQDLEDLKERHEIIKQEHDARLYHIEKALKTKLVKYK
jgi:uncharacterized membrane protein